MTLPIHYGGPSFNHHYGAHTAGVSNFPYQPVPGGHNFVYGANTAAISHVPFQPAPSAYDVNLAYGANIANMTMFNWPPQPPVYPGQPGGPGGYPGAQPQGDGLWGWARDVGGYAIAGAVIGSFIPVIGTGVGAAIGAVVGVLKKLFFG